MILLEIRFLIEPKGIDWSISHVANPANGKKLAAIIA